MLQGQLLLCSGVLSGTGEKEGMSRVMTTEGGWRHWYV